MFGNIVTGDPDMSSSMGWGREKPDQFDFQSGNGKRVKERKRNIKPLYGCVAERCTKEWDGN